MDKLNKNLKLNITDNKSVTGVNGKRKPVIKYLLSQGDKMGEKTKVKELFNHYEQIGLNQVRNKKDRFRKLYNLAYGSITSSDYVEGDLKNELEMLNLGENTSMELDLDFYPIIPNIVNVLVNNAEKRFSKYRVSAINPEASNELIDKYNSDIRNLLVSKLEAVFQQQMADQGIEEGTDVYNQQAAFLQESRAVQDFYKTEFRHEIELWANHVMEMEDEKFNIKSLEKEVLRKLLITEHPFIHVNYLDGNYYPELLDEGNTFWLKSPMVDDVSESQMFGWFEFENFSSILNKWANILTESQVKVLESWTDRNKYGFIESYNKGYISGNNTKMDDAYQNLLTMKNLDQSSAPYYRPDEYPQSLIRVSTIYFMLPRKMGKLTVNINGQKYSDIVDENFKVTIPPVYDSPAKDEFSLVYGEHVQWFYINELWKGVKLDRSLNSAYRKLDEPTEDTIWLSLERCPIQYRKQGFRYGTIIPVHGGPETNLFNDTFSLVQKAAPWQIFYNFLWNRNKQLLSTEIGKFLAFNQAMIPQESFDGSWGKNNLQKFYMVAHDTSLAPLDNSLSNTGQAVNQTGYGQIVDLNKTQDVLEKAQLAKMCKDECYSLIGISPEMMGEISPYQSGKSVAQGLQRTSNQIQHYYNRASSIMKRARQTMLETAQYLAIQSPIAELSYITSEKQRAVFQALTEGWSLYSLGIYVENSISNTEATEMLKDLVLRDNTMGSSLLEKAMVIESDNTSVIIEKLKQVELNKEMAEKARQKAEQEALDKQLQSQQAQIDKDIAYKTEKDALDRENDIMVAQIRAIGFGNSEAFEIKQQVLDLQKANDTQEQFYRQMTLQERIQGMKENESSNKQSLEERKARMEEEIKRKELELREKEIAAANERTRAMIKKKNNK